MKKPRGFFEERSLPAIEMTPGVCDISPGATFCCLALAEFAALAGGGFLLPQDTLSRLGARRRMNSLGRSGF